MAIITYDAGDNPAREIEWYGVAFVHGEPIETEDAALIAAAKANRFFTVLEDAGVSGEVSGDNAVKRGPGRPPKAASDKEGGE